MILHSFIVYFAPSDCSFSEATDALTNTPPSTCRCFWGSQEGEAGSILFQELLRPASEEEGTVIRLHLHVGDVLCKQHGFLVINFWFFTLGHAWIIHNVQETIHPHTSTL